jgi:peptidylprolyl isomerase
LFLKEHLTIINTDKKGKRELMMYAKYISYGCTAIVLLGMFSGCSCERERSQCTLDAECAPYRSTTEADKTILNTDVTQKESMDSVTPQELILPSGLGFTILQDSDKTEMPAVGNTVVVHYTGWLADAQGKADYTKKFDSSIDRKQPFGFKIGMRQVIPGWDEGVMRMKVGQKVRLSIPSELGYGARGAGGVIPPHAKLIFDVELLEIKK